MKNTLLIDIYRLKKITRTPVIYVSAPVKPRYDPYRDQIILPLNTPPETIIHEFSHAYFFKQDSYEKGYPYTLPPQTYQYYLENMRLIPREHVKTYKAITHLLIDINNTRRMIAVTPEYSPLLLRYLDKIRKIAETSNNKLVKTITYAGLGLEPPSEATGDKTLEAIHVKIAETILEDIFTIIDTAIEVVTMMKPIVWKIPTTIEQLEEDIGKYSLDKTLPPNQQLQKQSTSIEKYIKTIILQKIVYERIEPAKHVPNTIEKIIVVKDYVPKVKPSSEAVAKITSRFWSMREKTRIEEIYPTHITGLFDPRILIYYKPRYIPYLSITFTETYKPKRVLLLDGSSSMEKYYVNAVNVAEALRRLGILDKIYVYHTCEEGNHAYHILYIAGKGYPPTNCRNADSVFIRHVGEQLPPDSEIIVISDGIPNSQIYIDERHAIEETRRTVIEQYKRGIRIYPVYVHGGNPSRKSIKQLEEIYGVEPLLVSGYDPVSDAKKIIDEIMKHHL